MKYYKFKWNELRGDQFDSWGYSLWYIETGIDDYPTRQIEIYDSGKVLKYSLDKPEDEYGGIGDQKIDLSEFGGKVCTKSEFEMNWLLDFC